MVRPPWVVARVLEVALHKAHELKFPLSHIVQSMRKTQQTSLYLEHLGPFFVGRAVWQSPL